VHNNTAYGLDISRFIECCHYAKQLFSGNQDGPIRIRDISDEEAFSILAHAVNTPTFAPTSATVLPHIADYPRRLIDGHTRRPRVAARRQLGRWASER
jgi:hypothetical protein